MVHGWQNQDHCAHTQENTDQEVIDLTCIEPDEIANLLGDTLNATERRSYERLKRCLKGMCTHDRTVVVVKFASNNVFDINQYELSVGDFSRVLKRNWIDDTIVNAYMCLLRCKCSRVKMFTTFFADTHMWTLLKSKQLARHTQQGRSLQEFFDERITFYTFPVLIRKNHWISVCFDVKQLRITIYDSMRTITEKDETCFKRVFQNLLILRSTDATTYSLQKISHVDNLLNLPVQSNHHDCGIYMLSFANMLSRGKSITDSLGRDVERYARRRIALHLQNCSVP
eukprot:gene9458-11206_t